MKSLRNGELKLGKTNKFKKGDLIILNRTPININAKCGATAKVVGYSENGKYVNIQWIKNELSKGQCNGGYCEKNFDLLTRDGITNWKMRYIKC